MKCIEADALIQQSLDGALTAGERNKLDRHLETCSACSRAFEEYRSLTRVVGDWSRKDPHSSAESREFLAGVISAIESAPETPRPAIGQIAGVGVFVAVVVGVIGYLTPGLQPASSIVAVHPMGIVDSVIATLSALPTDVIQSLQAWITDTPGQLPVNEAAWTEVGATAMLIAGRILASRRKAASGGTHG